MDSTDNFSHKSKKDLAAIAILFGLLTQDKVSKMTKPQLIQFLQEQESRSAASSESVQSKPVKRPIKKNVTVAGETHSVMAKISETEKDSKPEGDSLSSATKSRKKTPKLGAADTTLASSADVEAEMLSGIASDAVTDSLPDVTSVSSPLPNKKGHAKKAAKKDVIASDEEDPVIPEEQGAPYDLLPTVIDVTPEANAVESSMEEANVNADRVVPKKRSRGSKKHEISLPETDVDSDTSAVVSAEIVISEEMEISGGMDQAASSEVTEKQVVAKEIVAAAPGNTHKGKIHRRSITITPKDELPSHESTDVGGADSADGEENPESTHHRTVMKPKEVSQEMVSGVLEIVQDGAFGFLRRENYLAGPTDVFVPAPYLRRFGLRTGDYVTGPARPKRDADRYQSIQYIKEVNGMPPEKMLRRAQFDRLTPIYPEEKFILETQKDELSTRIIDLVAPIGKGQRGMIVSPPKAGKTILLQKIANAISINNPNSKLIVLLIDERPEEVTDMQRSINGEVVYSTFDKTPENHTRIVELVLERAMRLVELEQDVVILLDSMTRLARAYNLTINPTGRTLSGGLDPGALYGPKRFFGAARNIENGGSLTIIATSLIETGSRMDEVIFEEFKGTGNMEVYLDRKLSEKRIFPAIDINKSGTRREELLLAPVALDAVWTIRKAFSQLDTSAVTEMIISLLLKTATNNQFVQSVNVSFNDKALYDAMRGSRPNGSQGASQNGMNK